MQQKSLLYIKQTVLRPLPSFHCRHVQQSKHFIPRFLVLCVLQHIDFKLGCIVSILLHIVQISTSNTDDDILTSGCCGVSWLSPINKSQTQYFPYDVFQHTSPVSWSVLAGLCALSCKRTSVFVAKALLPLAWPQTLHCQGQKSQCPAVIKTEES